MDSYTELSNPMDMKQLFETADYIKWNSFRQTEDSRFVTLVMPKVLARLPYGKDTKPVEAFDYEEGPRDEYGNAKPMKHDDYCWMNAAYALGARLTDAHARIWLVHRDPRRRGRRQGDRTCRRTCSIRTTAISTASARPRSASPTGARRNCPISASCRCATIRIPIIRCSSARRPRRSPKKYDRPEATANAAISARLPYLMATSRFAHYLKVMARDKIGSFMEASDTEKWLNRWIAQLCQRIGRGGPGGARASSRCARRRSR